MNLRGTWFKHFKGTRYLVIGEATHSETLERMLIYQAEDNDKLWVRPYEMFMDFVPGPQRGVPIRRFTPEDSCA